ncbi:hypothetical protein SAMN04515671_4200 [Nakamurella panacisegetis]|uniref:Uncharacterized protein n=1 Tax=Nakamurella panacisegetis TaxID=1090615 RepID=A0A1H0SMX9_9ACTN|nr:hypothetical protein [Nakamurella panacisegetis]SDP43111.1 hypothetical protein SAMN04515671_4200 [Nakamurella panacisegetis]
MPTPNRTPDQAAVATHYRAVGPTLLTHLIGRRVLGFGRLDAEPTPADPFAELHIAEAADLTEAIRSGIISLRLPGLAAPGLVAFRIRPGADSGIDVVATAALALAEALARHGRAATTMTDGRDGLYLIGFGVGPTDFGGGAAGYARALAAGAPEVGTTDHADTAGRALLIPVAPDDPLGLPAPYTLGSAGGDLGVIAPLTSDEVAAVTAGMPLDLRPTDLATRIAEYGDLAAGLAEVTGAPA